MCTASLVYQNGVSGVWLSLQTLFMPLFFWFMNAWFRRVRLVTVADLFEDRFGTRTLARFYAQFQTSQRSSSSSASATWSATRSHPRSL